MKRGEVWTVAGGAAYAGKPRPAVIIQDDRFDANDSAGDVRCEALAIQYLVFFPAAGERRFAPTRQPVIGFDFHKKPVGFFRNVHSVRRKCLYFHDFLVSFKMNAGATNFVYITRVLNAN